MRSTLHSSAKYGIPGKNTGPCPASKAVRTITAADGFGMIAPDDMYRIEELQPDRREPRFPNMHNLHDDVFARTLNPSRVFPADRPELEHRATVWDVAAAATREALKDVPPNSHINICANSGPYSAKLESLPPWTAVRDAAIGLLYVAEFRHDDANEPVHPAWRQIAVPITSSEGRLLAGLRLLPTVAGRTDLTFTITNLTNPTIAAEHMNIVRDTRVLKYGCVANSWKATNLGCFFHDGDLYGWDEAVLYTRNPVAVINDTKPPRRFDVWYDETVYRNVTWYEVVDGRLKGGKKETTTRADLIEWDKTGVPGEFLDETLNENGKE